MKRFLYIILWVTGLALLVCLALPTQAQTNISATVQIHTGGGKMAEYNSLTFTSGDVITPRTSIADNISFRPGSSHTGASDASHVNGYAEKVGNTAFTFPVGSGSSYRPAGISAPASASSVFQAAYFAGNPSSASLPAGAPFSISALGSGVTAVSPVEYWDVNGSGPVNLIFTWNPASNLNILAGGNLANLIMVGWNGSQWVNLGTPTTAGTLSGTGTLSVSNITPNTYSAYTFGSLTQTILLTADTDGDGVTNDLDLDDDNDGILDTVEQNFKFYGYNGAAIFRYDFSPTTGVSNQATIQTVAFPSGLFQDDAAGAGNFGMGVINGKFYGYNGAGIFRYDFDPVTGVSNQTLIQAVSFPTGIFQDDAAGAGNFGMGFYNGKFYGYNGAGIFRYDFDPVTGVSNQTLIQAVSFPTGIFQNDAAGAGNFGIGFVDGKFYGYNGAGIFSYDFDPVTGVSNQSLVQAVSLPQALFQNDTEGAGNFSIQLVAQDTDNDGIADYLDLDSDNDGIPDNVEAQTTVGYVSSGTVVDAQGRLIAYGTSGLTPVNTDGDAQSDYIDTDSDGDSISDTQEAAITKLNADADKDGLDDNTKSDKNTAAFGPNGANIPTGGVLAYYPSTNGTQVDWRTNPYLTSLGVSDGFQYDFIPTSSTLTCYAPYFWNSTSQNDIGALARWEAFRRVLRARKPRTLWMSTTMVSSIWCGSMKAATPPTKARMYG